MTVLSVAQQFLNLGIGIIPVKFREKTPDATRLPNGKWESFKTQLPTVKQVDHWFSHTDSNYGLVAGWQGLVLIDFDDAQEYVSWLLWATRTGGLPKFIADRAYRVSTSRGVHVYLRTNIPSTNRKLGHVDIKYRGYVLGPGSIHPSGTEYRALGSVLFFPVITTLSDVLPPSLLQQVSLPSGVQMPASAVPAPCDDPWKAAMSVQQHVPGVGAVDKIKSTFRIEDFFTGTTRTGAGWLLAKCPFHDDDHPSLWINTEQQICNCFTCLFPAPMDVINLYARLYGMNNTEAIFALGQGSL